MEFKEFGKIARLSRQILVTEKIDGTNGCVGISDPGHAPAEGDKAVRVIDTPAGSVSIFAGSRSRWLLPVKGSDNFGFAQWVFQNAEELMQLGPGRHFGEWWGQGIQRGYGLDHKRFSLFNVSRWSGPNRGGAPECCSTVPILYEGDFHTGAVDASLEVLRSFGSLAAPGFKDPEGLIVYHAAGDVLFKKTLKDDEVPKALSPKAA